jgi:hypothetical protein
MDETQAKEYAKNNFERLGAIEAQWNYFHSRGIISAINELVEDTSIDKNKLFALAWVHDIGKIQGEENHAEKGVKILLEDFNLDEVDIDCIKNHGSSSKPVTKEGKLFRYCDGLSLFYPEVALFRFYAGGKEGNTFEEIKEWMKKYYEKYLSAYSDNPKVIDLLKKKFAFLSLME